MPLRLKSLELQGYKTFASRTLFEFSEGITAIVGPNGSGKSNIADALRWVLGEQSYLLLRGKKTEDMIFHGSESRARSGMGSATIVFDNTDNWLPVDFTEVAVARRAYRDGRNEYLLNNQQLRLRDLNELLAQSGLSERTYTILGQGMVDASLALKSEDRRRLFEEAAGIGLFRSRREEAVRRLESTERNLERVLDILSELEPRLKSLERQARRAQEYRQIQADLRLLLLDWYGFHWHRTQRDLAQLRASAQAEESRTQAARADFNSFIQDVESSRHRISDLRREVNDWNHMAIQLTARRESNSRQLAVIKERQRALAENRQQALQEQFRVIDQQRLQGERLVEASADVDRLKADLAEALSLEVEARERLQARQSERLAVEEQLRSERQALTALTAEKARLEARLDELHGRFEAQRQRLDSAEAAIAQAEAVGRRAQTELSQAGSVLERAEIAAQAAEVELASGRARLEEIEAGRRACQEQRAVQSAEYARQKAQLEVLEQAEQSLVGFAEGTRALLEATRQGRLAGAQGALSTGLDVPAELETAIAAALGDHLEAILLARSDTVDAALELLEVGSAGRAALLPLDWLTPGKVLNPPSDADCVGVASLLVRAPDSARPALDLLLGQTLIVRDRKSARRLLRASDAQRVVTLRGEVFRADGLVVAGKDGRSGAIGRPRQRQELQVSLATIEAGLAGLEKDLDQSAGELAQARADCDMADKRSKDQSRGLEAARSGLQQAHLSAEAAQQQVEWQAAQKRELQRDIVEAQEQGKLLVQELNRLNIDLAHRQESVRDISGGLAALDMQEFMDQVTIWNARAQVAEHAVGEAQKRLEERHQTTGQLEVQAQALDRRVVECDESLREMESQRSDLSQLELELQGQLAELRAQIEPAEAELDSAEKDEIALQEREMAARRELQAAERQHSQMQIELARKQEAAENLRRRIVDDFGLVQLEYEVPTEADVPLPLGDLVATLPQVQTLDPETELQLTQKKAQLRRMGAINLEAQQEYEETLERFNYMSAQIEDLREAEVDLRQVIAELDDVTRKEFVRTFEAVAGHFREIFVRLFGGGSARLVLTDPDNLTETGIDIEARLPGKREQGLALLSGGERSLTAIALIFALLKVAPTPLCVLDEVDAMLDEANVGRFRDLLDELSQETQFIVITHNRNTVQAADMIYGVTMGRDSVSQVISLRLDEITEKMMER